MADEDLPVAYRSIDGDEIVVEGERYAFRST